MRTIEGARIVAITLAVAGVGSGLYLANANGWFNHDSPVSSDTPKPDAPLIPLPRDYSILSPQEIQDEARNTLFQDTDLNKEYDNLRNSTSRDQLMQEAQRIVLDEAKFYQQVQKDPAILINRSKDIVRIRGKNYDLRTSKGILFADVVFEILYREKLGVRVSWHHSDTDSLTDIEELYDRMDVLESDNRPFLGAVGLSSLNRTLKILESAGQTVPTKIILDHSQNVFASQGGIMRLNDDTFRNIAEFYESTNPALVGDFQKVSQNNFVSDFTAFISNGRGFRRRILYFETKDIKSEAAGLTAEYDLFRQFFGTDFSISGQPKKLHEYQSGNIVEIDDPEERINPNNFGILLRPTARLDRDPSWPYVRNGRLVRVINNQKEIVLNEGAQEVAKMVQVESGEIVSTKIGDIWMPIIPPERGWLPKDYLGAIVGN